MLHQSATAKRCGLTQVLGFMKPTPSHYRQIIDRALCKKLIESGFREIQLIDCISYEALFRKGDAWFGTSWDYRDLYLDLNFGHLYWIKDVMPRVIIAGQYSSFYPQIKRLDNTANDYLEKIAASVSGSIETALNKYRENPSLADSRVPELRQGLLGRATDAQLIAHEA
ncbi:hypothetical protein [Solilutibacter silvestris]|uniref:hypothetical protein n=1 Tax=Solilutibacter silvestris TaxID=1645665 RepID=UPI003D349538